MNNQIKKSKQSFLLGHNIQKAQYSMSFSQLKSNLCLNDKKVKSIEKKNFFFELY